MGYFIEGYEQGKRISNNECSAEEHENILKDVLSKAKYSECVEWYNGFYKAMLDIDLKRLESAYLGLKEKAVQNEIHNNS